MLSKTLTRSSMLLDWHRPIHFFNPSFPPIPPIVSGPLLNWQSGPQGTELRIEQTYDLLHLMRKGSSSCLIFESKPQRKFYLRTRTSTLEIIRQSSKLEVSGPLTSLGFPCPHSEPQPGPSPQSRKILTDISISTCGTVNAFQTPRRV